MAGTIDSAVTKKSDADVDKEAKIAQKQAEQRRAEERREGPENQAPGEMPPEHHDQA
ncbi:MAG: hypothetical protein JWN48_3952 [Myxococcaceae bacterium]|nr:hypothetical protein [Myxococcaceae bacterium]